MEIPFESLSYYASKSGFLVKPTPNKTISIAAKANPFKIIGRAAGTSEAKQLIYILRVTKPTVKKK